MSVRTETASYQADGLTMVSHLYIDDSRTGARPGILVFPEAFGLSAHAKSRAERLAGLGYAALACDLHGDGKMYSDLGEVMGLVEKLRADPAHLRARAAGGLKTLAARADVNISKIAAIGYCLGGTMALELARSGADIAAAIAFHGGLATVAPQDAKRIKGKILACIGADDPGIPADQRAAFEAEMRAACVDWRLHVYGGVVHSFTNPDADKMGRPEFARYDAGADRRSWGEMLAVFDEVFV